MVYVSVYQYDFFKLEECKSLVLIMWNIPNTYGQIQKKNIFCSLDAVLVEEDNQTAILLSETANNILEHCVFLEFESHKAKISLFPSFHL